MKAFVAITLRSIGVQASQLALFELAKAWAAFATPYTAWMGPLHLKAAAAFAAVGAVGIAAGGAATRAGWADETEDDKKSSASSASSGSGGYQSGSRAVGETVQQQTIVINQYASGFVRTDRELGAMADSAIRSAQQSGMTSTPRNG